LLFVGQDDSVFWFSKDEGGGLAINILDKDNNIDSDKIGKDSLFKDYCQSGNDTFQVSHGDLTIPQALPNLIRWGNFRLVTFTYFKYDKKPSVMFYDISNKTEVMQVEGVCMFLHAVPDAE
jgi:hypothetical protein